MALLVLVCLTFAAGLGWTWRSGDDAQRSDSVEFGRLAGRLVGTALAVLPLPVLGLLAAFSCGELGTPIPGCTGRTSLSNGGGWGSGSNSPLWVPGLLVAAGFCLGVALWLVATWRTHRRARWFLFTGQVIVFSTFGFWLVREWGGLW